MTNPPQRIPRIALIDTLRGIALIAMASYHFTWDLEFFGYVDPGTATHGFFRLYARSIASTFLFLAGVSLVLAHTPAIRWSSFWKRLGIVAGAAVAVSVATLFLFDDEWIYFGVLHNIALASLIGLAFLRAPLIVPGLAALVIIGALVTDIAWMPGVLDTHVFDTRFLSWIGFAAAPARSNDYVPLFPWLAAFLTGIFVARLALKLGWLHRLATVQIRQNILSLAGRHSLAFYLIHQPVLIGLVYLASIVYPAPPPDLRPGYIASCQSSCSATSGGNERLCESFCSCTADAMISQNLMLSLQRGTITPQDARVQKLAQECSISAEQN